VAPIAALVASCAAIAATTATIVTPIATIVTTIEAIVSTTAEDFEFREALVTPSDSPASRADALDPPSAAIAARRNLAASRSSFNGRPSASG
jgi:hypothetical protein